MNSEELRKYFEYSNGTLRNKLGIRNADELEEVSYQMSAKKANTLIKTNPKIKSIDDLCKIHKYMFGDLFDWAGKLRNYNIGKTTEINGQAVTTDFLDQSVLNNGILAINDELNNLPENKISVHEYANILDSVNFLHPFREGNGRSTKCFLQCLAQNHGQEIDYNRDQNEFIVAENNADVDALSKLLTVNDLKQKTLQKSNREPEIE